VIFVANHPTMLDALLLVARLPRSACIMKADLMGNVFLGAGARLARYISNKSARTMVRLAVNDLRNGGQLVIFPEGTRTVTPPLNPFRPGTTLIAKLAQAPIQTVFIDTDSPYLSKGWPLWRVPPLPIVFNLRLGKRFAPTQDSDVLQADLEHYFRQNMEQRATDASPRMPDASRTHLVLIPSYNTGERLFSTVAAARAQWNPVWVVVDGSDDGTGERLQRIAAGDPGLRVWVLPQNQGKGSAVLHGLRAARDAGFTHALTMDSDGQHPAELIPEFMRASLARPETMVLGRPVFDASAPLLRVRGRRVSNGWTQLETLFAGVGDSLYGFRVYPVTALIAVMRRQPWMRRFDFDTEAVVRLAWRGVKPVNIDAPVKYLTAEEGGVSHFRYGRDNVLLTWMHARLMVEFVLRLPGLVIRKLMKKAPFQD
jgi:1-acyl-sn-glycerol-3-phosphate acyltransferase